METIIVQENDESILDVLTYALEDEGFTVYPLKDCDNFLQLIDRVRPHVVMLDYRLDDKRSQDICREIKANYPHLPVLALSCNSNIHEQYNTYGFDDYIKKPFDLDLLYSVLRKHISVQNIEL